MAIPINNKKIDYINYQFPNICANYEVLGNDKVEYNCVAYAADDELRWYWPSPPERGFYWPPGIPRKEDLDSFVALFLSLKYTPCNLNEKYENGFEKVAIYVDEEHLPLHVAKQCVGDSGCWRSKLSNRDLIKHTLAGLCGLFDGRGGYGNIAVILKRPAQIIRPTMTLSSLII